MVIGKGQRCYGETNKSSRRPSIGICCANRTELIQLYGLDNSAHADPIWERPCLPEQAVVTGLSTSSASARDSVDQHTTPSISTSTPTNKRGSTHSPISSSATDASDSNGDLDKSKNEISNDERTTQTAPNKKVITNITEEDEANILGELRVIPENFPIPKRLPSENDVESQNAESPKSAAEKKEIGNTHRTAISSADINVEKKDKHAHPQIEEKNKKMSEEKNLQQGTTGIGSKSSNKLS
ncbi:hypothetical protein KIN20_032730 [Parelaphostrongylus tenuis]|uniref:Uncharacterized protein n=1 Tax=Parelaphostrongylus tenuis TaxID=148309 RepID=A0AAD5R7D2_PARTN|nr:hypothetical protein KIN20_032730 [Parelaphostrongylus tenuis]